MACRRARQQERAFPFAGDRILAAIGKHRLVGDIGGEAFCHIRAIDAPMAVLLGFRKAPVARDVLAERVGEGEVEQAVRLCDAQQFVERGAVVADMFQDMRADDDVVGGVRPVDRLDVEPAGLAVDGQLVRGEPGRDRRSGRG